MKEYIESSLCSKMKQQDKSNRCDHGEDLIQNGQGCQNFSAEVAVEIDKK